MRPSAIGVRHVQEHHAIDHVQGVRIGFIARLLYGLVVSEQYSLLMGAIALLCVVAVLMHLTRKVDWSSAAAAASAPR